MAEEPEIVNLNDNGVTPSTSWEMKAKVVQGLIHRELLRLADKYADSAMNVQIQVKPKKSVIMQENCNKFSDLKFAPFTLKVEYQIDSPKIVPASAVDLGLLLSTGG